MRVQGLGRLLVAAGILSLCTSIAEAGFHHHRRLRQGGCSDTCQTASAWGNSGYGCAAAGFGYGAAYAAPVQTYVQQASPMVFSQPTYVQPAYSQPSQPGYESYPAIQPSYAGSVAGCGGLVQQTSPIDVGPVTMYKVVLEAQTSTETRVVASTEYRDETRTRVKTVQRTQPVQVQEYRTRTITVPKTESKTIEYSVLVPHTSERSVEVVETVPVWKDVNETYTVKVPVLNDVQEEYEVKVAQLQDQEFTYTVYVPQAETQTRMQTVTNAVPVTKSRTIQVSVPVSRMTTVTRDYGHWETRVEEVGVQSMGVGCGNGVGSGVISYPAPACGASGYGVSYGMGGCSPNVSACGHCGNGGCRLLHHSRSSQCAGGCGQGGCSACTQGYSCAQGGVVYSGVTSGLDGSACGTAVYSAPATQTVSRRVWVPNVVTEEVPVIENVSQSQELTYTCYEQHSEQIPYECTVVSYRPETRTGTRKVVNYVPEKRTRTRKVVSYNDEQRTRTHRVVSYEQKTRTETYPVVSYTTEKRTKEVSFTVNVPETQVEPYTSTRYETVEEAVTEEYTVRVPYTVTKEVQVSVCRMVPKLVAYQVNLCLQAGCGGASGCASASGGSVDGGVVYGAGVGMGGCVGCGVQVGCPGCGSAAPAPCGNCR